MVAIMACLQVICSLYIRRFMVFFGFDISVGSLILLPVILYTFQIVAECYGWQYSRQIVWLNFIVNGIVTILTFSFGLIPYSSFNHDNLKMAYINLADTMWINSAMTWVLVFLSDYITSALMCSSRFQFNGRFVLPRMLILHLLGEIIILSGNFVVLPANGYSIEQTWHIVVSIFLARTISSLMLLPVARLVVWFIQHKVEGVVVFDYKKDFNPFKFKVDPNLSVQFNTTGWDKADARKVDIKKIAYDFYNDEFFDNLPGNPLKGYRSKKDDLSTEHHSNQQNQADKDSPIQ